jgi:hypothetical protein
LSPGETVIGGQPIGEAELERLQHQSFSYFLAETNADNGRVIDKTALEWPASIAATGFALGRCCASGSIGATRRIRTDDLLITNQLLYQLS